MILSRVDVLEDLTFILYLTPLIASAVYALYLWLPTGLSTSLPKSIYLAVTKNPYLFLIGLVAVCGAVLLEVYLSPPDSRVKKLAESSHQVQILATVCVIFALISVWSAADYSTDTRVFLTIFLEGRYALIYPLLLFLIAPLLNPTLSLRSFRVRGLTEDLSMLLMVASPLILLLLWRLHAPWEAMISTTLIILAAGLLLLTYRAEGRR